MRVRCSCITDIFVVWLYQLSWKCKLATVTSYKADVSSVSPSSERNIFVALIRNWIAYANEAIAVNKDCSVMPREWKE